jgi:hypothetical protein
VDANHGWAVGASGTILATGDGGATWTQQTSGTTNTLNAVSFVDTSHGWATGLGGTILATNDGGATWTPQSSGTGYNLVGVSFVDANHGWAVGGPGLSGFGAIVAFTGSPPSGSLAFSPSAGPAGSTIGVTSVTACPAGSTSAGIHLDNSAGAQVASATAGWFDASGDWGGTVAVPGNATNGAVFFVSASCLQPAVHGTSVTQNYASGAFTVCSIGSCPDSGPPGPPGPAGPGAPKLLSSSTSCVTKTTRTGSTQTCKTTYNYAVKAASAGAVIATAIVDGRRQVIGHGHIRHHRLRITVAHLRRGRYRVTVLEPRAHHAAIVVAHVTIRVR